MPTPITVINNGIKYIKINKVDFNGLDLDNPIDNINTLRIRYSNGNIGNYSLYGIPTEYADYYLLRVYPETSYTSSTDNTILNYRAVASKGFASIPNTLTKISSLTVSSNPSGYLTGSSGNYISPNLSNVFVQITGSFQVEEVGGGIADVVLYLVSSIRGTLSIDSVSLGTGGIDTLNIKYSDVILEDEILNFYWQRQGSSVANTGASSIIFTQSAAPSTPSENIVVFEPYATTNYNNSDYNATINNAVTNRISSFYQDVDYTTNQLIPVNFEPILSGSATRTAIPDSSFTSYRVSNPRYRGMKNTTDGFNNSGIIQSIGIETNNYPKDIGTSTLGLPSVDLNQTYFGYFNSVASTDPELGTFKENKSLYNLRYYIDEFGNTIKPLNDSKGINLGIMNQNFTEGTTAISLLTNPPQRESSVNGNFPIFKSGKIVEPILYSQYSIFKGGETIGYNYTGSIQFFQPVGTTEVTDWNFKYYKTTNQTFINNPGAFVPATITFNLKNYDIDGSPRFDGSAYTFNADTDTPIKFKSNIVGYCNFAANYVWIYFGYRAELTLQLQVQKGGAGAWSRIPLKNPNGGGKVNQVSLIFDSAGPKNVILEAWESSTYGSGDKVRVYAAGASDNAYTLSSTIYVLGEVSSYDYNKPSSYFTLNQSQAPTGDYTASVANGDFWTTGSASRNVLTGSYEISNYYGLEAKYAGISGSGFKPVVYPFQPQPYTDEIRFEAVEGNSYTINDVQFNVDSAGTGSLFLYLDRDLNGGTNTNFFLLRRYIDDPAYMILDNSKPSGSVGPGIVKPPYLISRAEDNINTILQTLEEKGLIEK